MVEKVQNQIIGRMTCPICEEERQDVKLNKNGNLYCNCDNNCSSRFTSKQSKGVKVFLEAGKVAKIGNRVITPLEFKYSIAKQKEIKADEQRQGKVAIREPRGDNFIGRTDGAVTSIKPTGVDATKPRGGALSWLIGDDD